MSEKFFCCYPISIIVHGRTRAWRRFVPLPVKIRCEIPPFSIYGNMQTGVPYHVQYDREIVDLDENKHTAFVLTPVDAVVDDNGSNLSVTLTTPHLLKQSSRLITNVTADGTYKV